MTVVQHFDDAVRRTPYGAFVAKIQAGTALAGLLMTPDAAFGFERRGTPDTLAELGRERGFDVVVVPPFTRDGRAVRSSDIRAAIAAGDLGAAAELLGRPVTLRGDLRDGALVLRLAAGAPTRRRLRDGRRWIRCASATRRWRGPAGGHVDGSGSGRDRASERSAA